MKKRINRSTRFYHGCMFFSLLILLLNVSLAFADGMIIPRPRPEEPQLPPLAVKYHHVQIEIDNQVAKTSISTEIEKFKPKLSGWTAEVKNEALKFIEQLEARGGTNINDALLSALQMIWTTTKPSMIIFLTDGLPTVGEQDIKKITANATEANKQNTRIFVFGVGNGMRSLLKKNEIQKSR